MLQLILSSTILSLLHSLIPNHWLPVLAIGKREKWTLRKTTSITFLTGMAHALSTILIGLIISLIGIRMERQVEQFTQWIAPAILILMGLYFIRQHHRHHHFRLHAVKKRTDLSSARIIFFLALAMFFSPCLEFEALYLLAWGSGWQAVLIISVIYLVVSVTGMVVWVRWAYRGLQKFNWHTVEHNAGLISGGVLILTGVLFFFFH